MKFCVMSNLRFETPAKIETFNVAVLLLIEGKPAWGDNVVSTGLDKDGYPSLSLEIRFDEEADANDLYIFIKDKMSKIPVLKGTVSKHNCTHDEATSQPCMIEEKYEC